MLMRPMLLLATMAVLAAAPGCTPPVPPPASYYREAVQVAPLVLFFLPGTDVLAPADAAHLQRLGETLPVWIQPELYLDGPRTLARAQVVRRLLGRRLVVLPNRPGYDGMADNDRGVLVAPVPSGVVADACLGPGQPVVGGVWPGDDARRARLLPAGCAVAAALQAQVDAAGGARDLTRGRPLPPGAATPFADAVERYYRRNDASGRVGVGSNGAGDRAGETSASGGAGPALPDIVPGQAVPGGSPPNPLLGPLPEGSAQPR